MSNSRSSADQPETQLGWPANLLRHPRFLGTLLMTPGREFTIRELSLRCRPSYATAWRLVDILADLGALRARRIGASRVVSVNPQSPLLPQLRTLAAVRLEPHRDAARRFARRAAKVKNVRRVVFFGSAARGAVRRGSDVDVAVVADRRGEASDQAIYRVAARVQDETGLKIGLVRVIAREFAAGALIAREERAGALRWELDCGGANLASD